jgi:DNA-binding MarR family transcriptional regulator
MRTSHRVTDRVGYQLKRAQQALRTAMDEGLRAQGITTPQYAALTALDADEPLSGAELARRGFVTAQTMNAILVGLERARLVERAAHAEHGRVIEARLTKRGRAKLLDAHATVSGIEERMLSGITAAGRQRLNNTLSRLVENLTTSEQRTVAERR